MQRICSWCGEHMGDSGEGEGAVTHGWCTECLETAGLPVIEVPDFTPDAYENLPFGILTLALDGTVVDYSDREPEGTGVIAEDLIGKNFLSDLAPCTEPVDFGGTFRDLAESPDGGQRSLAFLFSFSGQSRALQIRMARDAGHETIQLEVEAAD